MKTFYVYILIIMFLSGCDLLSTKEKSEKTAQVKEISCAELQRQRLEKLELYNRIKEIYKDAAGEERLRLCQRLSKIRDEYNAIIVKIREVKNNLINKQIVDIRRQIKSDQAILARRERELSKINEWEHQLGKMSRIATNNVCAWCGHEYHGMGTTCPYCGKTSVTKIGLSSHVSDVDVEVLAIRKKRAPIKEEIYKLKNRIFGYKNLLHTKRKLLASRSLTCK